MERKVKGAVEDYLEKMRQYKSGHRGLGLESLMGLENEEVSLRYIPKSSTRGGSHIFKLFDTVEKKYYFVAVEKKMVGESGKEGNKARKLAK